MVGKTHFGGVSFGGWGVGGQGVLDIVLCRVRLKARQNPAQLCRIHVLDRLPRSFESTICGSVPESGSNENVRNRSAHLL